MHRFKDFVAEMADISGRKTADVGMSHEVFTTYGIKHLIRTSSGNALSKAIKRSLWGDDTSKGATSRLRVSKIGKNHPLKKELSKHPEDAARKLYHDSAHTAAAITHYTASKYGPVDSVTHVGALTAGVNTLTDKSGSAINTNADIIVGAKHGNGGVRLIGKGLKYATSDSGAGSTKIYSPSIYSLSKTIDSHRRRADIPPYNGIGVHKTISNLIDDHTKGNEKRIVDKHHEFLATTFGDVARGDARRVGSSSTSGGKTKAAPKYDSSSDRPLNKSAMSHIRRMNEAGHPGATKFYNDLKSSNRNLQSDIAHHLHSSVSDVVTDIGSNTKKRKVAASLYKSMNNADSSIHTVVVSTVKKPGMGRPDVNIYNHNASVDDYINHVNLTSKDFSTSSKKGSGSFTIGKINFGVDSRPGQPSVMVNGRVNNSNFKHEATFTNNPEKTSLSKGKDGSHISWKDLK